MLVDNLIKAADKHDLGYLSGDLLRVLSDLTSGTSLSLVNYVFEKVVQN